MNNLPHPTNQALQISPKPPDINQDHRGNNSSSTITINALQPSTTLLKDIFLLDSINEQISHVLMELVIPHAHPILLDCPAQDLPKIKNCSQGNQNICESLNVPLSVDDLQRIYQPWKYSVIIKLMVKRTLHQYLKRKIYQLWKPTENFNLIDLGADYFIVKFNKEENMSRALNSGTWFINDFFLSV